MSRENEGGKWRREEDEGKGDDSMTDEVFLLIVFAWTGRDGVSVRSPERGSFSRI